MFEAGTTCFLLEMGVSVGSFILVPWHSLSSKPESQGRVCDATSLVQCVQREELLWDCLLLQMGYTVLPGELQSSPNLSEILKF